MRILNEKKILIISPEPWDHSFLSKHHLAIALSRMGNVVYFLNPPSATNSCVELAEYSGIFLVNYKPLVKGLHFLPKGISNWFCKKDVARIRRLTSVHFDIIWTFDPFRFQDIRVFNARWTIYHVADMHQAKHEDRLSNSVQIILSPSIELLERFERTKSVCIGHMVSEEFLNRARESRTRLPGKIQIGYVGNLLSNYLDFPLMVKAVQQNPQIDFTFIGEAKKLNENKYWQQIIESENVHFAGKVPHEQLAEYLTKFDLFWCCYDTQVFLREASNSHKILEYLSTGKPVVSTRIAAYLDKEDILYMPSQNNQLPELLGNIAGALDQYNGPEARARRIKFVESQTHGRVLEMIDNLLAKL